MTTLLRIIPAFALFALASCTPSETNSDGSQSKVATIMGKMKAKPADASGFLEGQSEMKKDERFPFHRVWVSKKWKKERRRYKKVIIPEINISYLRKTEWWERQAGRSQDKLEGDARKLADYWRSNILSGAERNAAAQAMTVVQEPGPDTLILEIAIIELIPNKVGTKVAGAVAGELVTGGGLIGSLGDGLIAFEMRVRDSQTNEVLLKGADRENFKSGMAVDLAQYTWYKGARLVIDEWVRQMTALYRLPFKTIVKDSSPFELIVL